MSIERGHTSGGAARLLRPERPEGPRRPPTTKQLTSKGLRRAAKPLVLCGLRGPKGRGGRLQPNRLPPRGSDERQSRSSNAAGAARRATEAAYHKTVHLQGDKTSGEAARLLRTERPEGPRRPPTTKTCTSKGNRRAAKPLILCGRSGPKAPNCRQKLWLCFIAQIEIKEGPSAPMNERKFLRMLNFPIQKGCSFSNIWMP